MHFKHTNKLQTIIVSIGLLFMACSQQIKYNYQLSDNVNVLADSAYNLCVYYNDSALAHKILAQLLNISVKMPDNIDKGEAYRTAALIYNHYNVVDSALYYYKNAESVFTALNNSESEILLAKTWLNMSLVYITGADYPTAVDYALKGEPVFLANKLDNYLINSYSKIAEIYQRLNELEKSAVYNKKTFYLGKNSENSFAKGSAFISLANYYIIYNKPDSAIYWLNMIEKNTELAAITENGIIVNCNKAKIYYELYGNIYKSIDYLNVALNYAIKYGSPYQVADIYERLSVRYKQINQPAKCLQYIKLGTKIAASNNFYELLMRFTELHANLLFEQNKPDQAYLKQLEFNNLFEKHIADKSKQQTLFLNAKFDASKRETQIKLLKTENTLAKSKLVRRNLFIAFFITLLLISILTIAILTRYYKQKQTLAKAEAEINNQKIKALEHEHAIIANQATLRGEEAERTRVARDLHDGLGGLLSGVKLSLYNMQEKYVLSGEMAQSLSNSLSFIDSSVAELRRIVHNMMPEVLHLAGIKTAIETFCNGLNHTSLNIKFVFYGSDIRFLPGFELSIYRITQELINNALKHANANKIIIQFIIEPNRLFISVTDDGIGFIKNNNNQGTGFDGIKTRIAAYNGRFDINSQLNNGTEALIEINNLNNYTV